MANVFFWIVLGTLVLVSVLKIDDAKTSRFSARWVEVVQHSTQLPTFFTARGLATEPTSTESVFGRRLHEKEDIGVNLWGHGVPLSSLLSFIICVFPWEET